MNSKQKKRALIIAYNNLNKSGVPTLIMQIVANLSDEYIYDVVVFSEKQGFFDNQFKSYGGNILVFKAKTIKNRILRYFWKIFIEKKQLSRFYKSLFKTKKYCLIHSFKEHDSYLPLKIAKKANIKKRIVHTTVIHSDGNFIFGLFDKIKRKKTSKYATNLIGVSENSCKSFGFINNYKVVPNPYDEGKYRGIVNATSNSLEITQIATFSDNKNQLFSLAVINEINKTQKCILHLVGSENESGYLNKLNKYILDNQLEDFVVFHDQHDSINTIFEHTTLTLLPSKKEGFGIVLLESQASGIPCIVSDNVPRDGDAGGCVFLELNPDLWAKTIIEYYKINKNARHKYDLDYYSNANFKKRLREIYSDL